MNETCPTVKVKTDAADNADGYILINESDFDAAVHELVDPPAKKLKLAKEASSEGSGK